MHPIPLPTKKKKQNHSHTPSKERDFFMHLHILHIFIAKKWRAYKKNQTNCKTIITLIILFNMSIQKGFLQQCRMSYPGYLVESICQLNLDLTMMSQTEQLLCSIDPKLLVAYNYNIFQCNLISVGYQFSAKCDFTSYFSVYELLWSCEAHNGTALW